MDAMLNTAQTRSPSVLTLDDGDFTKSCAALMQQVLRDWRPDALVGVRTGGVWVAERMAQAAGYDLPVLPITCRRPSTKHKSGSSTFRKLAAELPRPVLDGLRVI
jgi:hypoxanthine phosphoribosyltransferase